MPQGDKTKYTDKQKRKAEHIADSYEERGVEAEEAEKRAWATVNKDDGGGNKSGSGRGTHTGNPAAKKGGEKGGEASAARPAAERSASAKKAAETRKKNAEAD
ncbi:type II toxin-antitoxin system RelE/ParE family toxin [Pseudotabrizicola sp. 4114]|uniref:type II toxin-antitoxin system RelE/ParE family toxin n=1 Tax=Pseudotabrizicola sp. 4114 TaxID=2817731 RepID=UPI00285CAA0A|nr:plasmid stabilization system protein ParE [Pseudorhodobacter sp. 4114]